MKRFFYEIILGSFINGYVPKLVTLMIIFFFSFCYIFTIKIN